MEIGHWKDLTIGFDDAVRRVEAALAAEGFGIVSRIDVADILRRKIDRDVGRYLILGACNPTFAHQAIEHDPRVGVLLPCNVVVREDKSGKVSLGFIDPITTVGGDPVMSPLAAEVGARLARARDAVR